MLKRILNYFRRPKEILTLNDFLEDYYKWILKGAPENAPYSRGYGLCANAPGHIVVSSRLRIYFGRNNVPFNEDFEAYQAETNRGECHLNEARIAWVKGQINA